MQLYLTEEADKGWLQLYSKGSNADLLFLTNGVTRRKAQPFKRVISYNWCFPVTDISHMLGKEITFLQGKVFETQGRLIKQRRPITKDFSSGFLFFPLYNYKRVFSHLCFISWVCYSVQVLRFYTKYTYSTISESGKQSTFISFNKTGMI